MLKFWYLGGHEVCRCSNSSTGLSKPQDYGRKFLDALLQKDFDISYTLRGNGKIIVLLFYVDDILIIGVEEQEILELKAYLGKKFHMKVLGLLKCLLEIEVARLENGICLN